MTIFNMKAIQNPTRPANLSIRQPMGLVLLAAALFTTGSFPTDAATITTYAGGGGTDADNIPATNSLLLGMEGLALDPAGNLLIAHYTGARIRRVDHATGIISTSAGLAGDYGFSGDGGPATAARVGTPQSIASDLSGNVYFLDSTANCVRKINRATGLITTVAGIPNSLGTDQVTGYATNAAFFILNSIAVDVHGNLYLADLAGIIYKVDAGSGLVQQVAGSVFSSGFSNDGIPATGAVLGGPLGLAVDAADNLFFVDGQVPHTRVRRIDGQSGILTTVAGNGASNGSSGAATNADLNRVSASCSLAVDNLGGLYIGGVGKVWKVDLNTGMISILAGVSAGTGFSGDGGPATNALLQDIRGIACAGNGDVFITDTGNNRVRRILADPPQFAVKWFKLAGGGGAGSDGVHTLAGTIGQVDAGGPHTNSQFSLVGGFWALPVAMQVAGAPTLKIVPASPGFATVSWTPNTPGFLLQEALGLSPATWSNSPSGATNPITVPATLPVKFYRLTKP